MLGSTKNFQIKKTKFIAEKISSALSIALGISEIRDKRGKNFRKSGYYQLRFKTTSNNPKEALHKILDFLSPKGATLVQRSKNYPRLPGVKFAVDNITYDILVVGKNSGENFEHSLIEKMIIAVKTGEESQLAKKAFAALQKVDENVFIENISSITPRSGSTVRNNLEFLEDSGKIISDINLILKNGKKKYISLKSKKGSSIAQFGIGQAFSRDLKVNTASKDWKKWVEPLELDVQKMESGFRAYVNNQEIFYKDKETVNRKITPNSRLYSIIKSMWGLNYIYLKEINDDFQAIEINRDILRDKILKNLILKEIRYPSHKRKQISMYLQSDNARFKLEIRSAKGPGHVRPTQMQLHLLKLNLFTEE